MVWILSVYRYVSEWVYVLVFVGWKGVVDDKVIGFIFVVYISFVIFWSGGSMRGGIDFEIFMMIGSGIDVSSEDVVGVFVEKCC